MAMTDKEIHPRRPWGWQAGVVIALLSLLLVVPMDAPRGEESSEERQVEAIKEALKSRGLEPHLIHFLLPMVVAGKQLHELKDELRSDPKPGEEAIYVRVGIKENETSAREAFRESPLSLAYEEAFDVSTGKPAFYNNPPPVTNLEEFEHLGRQSMASLAGAGIGRVLLVGGVGARFLCGNLIVQAYYWRVSKHGYKIAPGDKIQVPEDVWMQDLSSVLATAKESVKALARRVAQALLDHDACVVARDIVLLDANFPALLPEDDEARRIELPFRAHADIERWLPRLVEANFIRRGAAADGTSLLLIRTSYQKPGRATLRLPKGKGGLLSLVSRVDVASARPGETLGTPTLQVKTVPHTAEGRTEHYVLALYVPPPEFDDKLPGLERDIWGGLEWVIFGADSQGKESLIVGRPVELMIEFKPAQPDDPPEPIRKAEFHVVRPPVILVHGTYDAPYVCWDTAYLGGKTLVEMLREDSFQVWLADYRNSSGRDDRGPSHFRDNAMMLWNAAGIRQRDKEVADDPDVDKKYGPLHADTGGIAQALSEFRRNGFAATQADVVGHSMGGVLARVYASKNYDQYRTHRYRRPENFRRGDIRRLITISSTHYGSDIERVMNAMEKADPTWRETAQQVKRTVGFSLHGAAGGSAIGGPLGALILGFVGAAAAEQPLAKVALWYLGKVSGAYEDQTPGSPALINIGPTPIPAHAIAAVASTADFDGKVTPKPGSPPQVQKRHARMELEYWRRLSLTYVISSDPVLRQAFERVGQPKDAERLLEMRKELRYYAHPDHFHKNPRIVMNLSRIVVQFYRSAIFGNSRNDLTVREESSLGGLKPPYTTVLENVLHGYAPSYETVKQRVVELLRGGFQEFDLNGFPWSGEDITRFYRPPGPNITVPDLTGLSPAEAEEILQRKELKMSPARSGPAASPGSSERIVGQDPPPGKEVRKFEEVKVFYEHR